MRRWLRGQCSHARGLLRDYERRLLAGPSLAAINVSRLPGSDGDRRSDSNDEDDGQREPASVQPRHWRSLVRRHVHAHSRNECRRWFD
jgi:hypothetical protein